MSLIRKVSIVVCVLLLGAAGPVHGQNARIVEWVENAPVSDDTRIALGYPVPIPVDTPIPFDGFRSYAGLHARHQDLAATTSWVHPFQAGATRQGRAIWAYQLGDPDRVSAFGLPEHAMLTNGGIHAREWQSAEVATGIIELFASGPDDHHLLDYLRDNANVLVIPILNVDGFLQTQRYPATNWLGTDPDDPSASPRDGRMRRKNMLGADEDLLTSGGHLLGVDLNRNNEPFWNTSASSSSGDPNRLTHHGASPQSEPETRALDEAANQGPADKLTMYTDLHSFSQVHFWTRNGNSRLTNLTEVLLRTFSNFHRAFPAGKNYVFSRAANTPQNAGIGSTAEYFTFQYQVPAWTLEIEPSDGGSYHAPLPGGGADYGGLGRNGHDGFILPEAEIARVRTELAQTFAIAYYRQSPPPSIVAMHVTDLATGAVTLQAEWDVVDSNNRDLQVFQAQPLQLGREYAVWIAWDKPMRWRENGQVSALPGQPQSTLGVQRGMLFDGQTLDALIGEPVWLDRPGASPEGYHRYRDDAITFTLSFPATADNLGKISTELTATLQTDIFDMTGNRGDADPTTVARWENGGWSGYEDGAGNDQNDSGGPDSTLQLSVSPDELGDPFVVDAGTTATWFDPEHDGEGFALEILRDSRAVMYWFTYDGSGNQDWYVAEGEIRGNRILFPELLRVTGGESGPAFDPETVVRTVVGSASFIWSSCDTGAMNWIIDDGGSGRQQGRLNLVRLTRLMALECGGDHALPRPGVSNRSGSWYDPGRDGEGYVLEILADQRALAFWFGFDGEGQRRWLIGTGGIDRDSLVFDDVYTTSGGVFGPGYDPDDVTLADWGSLQLQLGCDQGTARFEPSAADFPTDTLNLQRLTWLDGMHCDD